MNREIKFRAWDKVNNRMWYNVQNCYDTLNHHCCEDEKNCKYEYDRERQLYAENFKEVLEDESLCVIQFTGLLDKNNNPIYEGDILEWSDGFKRNNFSEVVRYSNKIGAFVSGERLNRLIIPFDSGGATTYNFEIIGNVFENKELLERK